jgi:hypothetical protein
MDCNKIIHHARKLAAKAKPGILKVNGNTYTFVFNQRTWNYEVYENLLLVHIYNTKSLSTAKRWMLDYLAN